MNQKKKQQIIYDSLIEGFELMTKYYNKHNTNPAISFVFREHELLLKVHPSKIVVGITATNQFKDDESLILSGLVLQAIRNRTTEEEWPILFKPLFLKFTVIQDIPSPILISRIIYGPDGIKQRLNVGSVTFPILEERLKARCKNWPPKFKL